MYGSANLTGIIYEDHVCIGEEVCLGEFPIFAISYQVGLDGIDGILGLSPKSEYSASMMLYSQFYEKKIIPRNEYSLFLNSGNLESSIYFGGRDSSKIRKGAKSYTYDVIDDMHWTIAVGDMFYGELSFFTNFYIKAVIDSGTSLMIIPYDDFAWLLEAVLAVDQNLK